MKKTAGLIALAIFFVSCKKTEQVLAPVTPVVATLSTTPISSITSVSATAGGNITSDGGAAITVRGVCYGKEPDPTTSNSFAAAGEGKGVFTVNINGLRTNTRYYARAFATNSVGTAYGPTVSFTTQIPKTVTDFDGNIYHTVKIGKQVWMVENLKTKNYSDGTPLSFGATRNEWINSAKGFYSYYKKDPSLRATYGNLYNWHAISDKLHKLAPAGWHIPTEAEWTTLINYLGGKEVAGGKLKEAKTKHWQSPNSDATDLMGFKALPGGFIYADPYDSKLKFEDMFYTGNWWSSTMRSNKSVVCYALSFDKGSVAVKERNSIGLSVRCIMD